MKRTGIKMISLICTVALFMSVVVTGGVSFTASATVSAPENPETLGEVQVTFLTGPYEKTYNGSDAQILDFDSRSGKAYYGILTTQDFNTLRQQNNALIEFDLYVSDAATLKTAMEANGTTFSVWICGKGKNFHAPNIPASKIKNSGWNHIVLSIANFYAGDASTGSDANNTWLAVDRVFLQFDGTKVGSGITFAMANFCGTLVTKLTEPQAGNAYATQFPHSPKTTDVRIDTLGYTTANTGGTLGRVKNLICFDLGGANSSAFSSLFGSGGYFEFDFYVDDYESFANMLSTYGCTLNMYFTSDSKSYSASNRASTFNKDNAFKYPLDKQITHDGWNHVVYKMVNGIDTSNAAAPQVKNGSPSTSGIRAYGIRIDDDSNENPVMPACAYNPFIITNVIVTQKATNLTASEGYRVAPLYKEKSFSVGSTFSALATNSKVTGITSQNFSTADKVEFDFFIESYGAIKKAMASNSITGINLLLSSNASTPTSNCIKCPFFDLIKESGWNHIVVPRSSWTLNSPTESAIVTFALEFTGSGTANSTTQGNMNFTVANIAGTANAETYASLDISRDGKNTTWGGTNYSDVVNRLYLPVDSIDVTKADTIEFDIYIADQSAFHTAFDSYALRFFISSAASQGTDVGRRTYNFTDYITRDGWNHISLGINSHFSTNSCDRENIKFLAFGCWSNTGTALPAIKGVNVWFANICATSKIYKAHSVKLDDAIGVNFHADLSGLSAAEKSGSYVTFDITSGSGVHKTQTANYDSGNLVNGNYYYTCSLSSVQMAETVVPTLHYGSNAIVGAPYSVKDYVDYINAHSASFTDKVKNLVKAMADYGHYSQKYLAAKNSWTAGTNYTAIDKCRASDYSSSDYNTKKTAISSKAISASGITNGSSSGKYFQYTLNFDYETSIVVKFNTGNVTFTSVQKGGANYANRKSAYTVSNCNLYLLHLPATQLGDTITVAGKVNGSSYTINVSALSYVYAVLNSGSTSAAQKNAVSAFYDYYAAAAAYVA